MGSRGINHFQFSIVSLPNFKGNKEEWAWDRGSYRFRKFPEPCVSRQTKITETNHIAQKPAGFATDPTGCCGTRKFSDNSIIWIGEFYFCFVFAFVSFLGGFLQELILAIVAGLYSVLIFRL